VTIHPHSASPTRHPAALHGDLQGAGQDAVAVEDTRWGEGCSELAVGGFDMFGLQPVQAVVAEVWVEQSHGEPVPLESGRSEHASRARVRPSAAMPAASHRGRKRDPPALAALWRRRGEAIRPDRCVVVAQVSQVCDI
jgi:hypothetical protein